MFSSGQRMVIIFIILSFLGLPLAAMVGGITEPYGRKPFSAIELSPLRLMLASSEKRNATLKAILERSPVTKIAIKARYWSMIHLEGFVNTDRIVSGRGSWLFYKPQFWPKYCGIDVGATIAVRRALLTTELVEGFGGKIVYTVSPDKAFANPEKISERTKRMFPCKLDESRRWREINAAAGSPINDHWDAVISAKATGQVSYYATDTHWTRNVSPYVINDIRASLMLKPVEWRLVGKEVVTQKPDLLSNMLLQKSMEKYERIILRPKKELQWPRVLVVHDSFYERLRKDFEKFWPGFNMIHSKNVTSEGIRSAFMNNTPVIYNSVERSFLKFGITDTLLQKSIISYMADFVEKNCIFKKEIRIGKLINLKMDGDGFRPFNNDPKIIYLLPKFLEGKLGCAKLKVTVEQIGRAEIFFNSNTPDQNFVTGRSIVFELKPGTNYLRFLIPKQRAENLLRIDPVNRKEGFKLGVFQVGELKPMSTQE